MVYGGCGVFIFIIGGNFNGSSVFRLFELLDLCKFMYFAVVQWRVRPSEDLANSVISVSHYLCLIDPIEIKIDESLERG